MAHNRITQKFRELKRKRQKAFIAYITAGDPDLKVTERLISVLEAAGTDLIEIGIPFSDPLADGPTIQAASQRALSGNFSLEKLFAMVQRLRPHIKIPLVFMTYYNPVFHYGEQKFIGHCVTSGIDGIIVPDLPPEEAQTLIFYCREKGMAPIFLVSPTTTPKRLKRITQLSEGFIYYVSLTGVTGSRKKLAKQIENKIRWIKRLTDKSVCVGFGISTPQQVASVAKYADGVIVGSAIVERISRSRSGKILEKNIFGFAKSLAEACHQTHT